MDVYHCNLWKAFIKSPVSGILILYTFVAAWFVGGLTVFHLYLIYTNQVSMPSFIIIVVCYSHCLVLSLNGNLICVYVQTTYENFRYRYEGKRNPHNRGCARNFVEIFCSKIPKSKNKFRDKVKGDSSSVFNSWMSSGRPMSPETNKTSIDMEMGKRQAVGAEDFEDMRSQMDSVGGLERCSMEPRHTNWEITPDIQMLAAEFGMEYGSTDRQKIHGSL